MHMAGLGGLPERSGEPSHLLERPRQGERPIFVSVSEEAIRNKRLEGSPNQRPSAVGSVFGLHLVYACASATLFCVKGSSAATGVELWPQSLSEVAASVNDEDLGQSLERPCV